MTYGELPAKFCKRLTNSSEILDFRAVQKNAKLVDLQKCLVDLKKIIIMLKNALTLEIRCVDTAEKDSQSVFKKSLIEARYQYQDNDNEI